MVQTQGEGLPEPVSTVDIMGLKTLSELYDGVLDNDVLAVRGEAVDDIIERSSGLAEKIVRGIGGVSADETVRVGLADLSNDERLLLESGRRVIPASRRIY